MIYVAFIFTLQSEEMTNASGLQGVIVSCFTFFVSTMLKKTSR